MAKVSLRIYNREIEGMIDQGRTDEAIAHCHHILKTFPKHLETYRLLGKSYLESKRYNDAVDIFGRVLMSVPDDFVAHVGMSIIRDDENKLDDSIWHMERAFEAQPSNAAIQGELQRLYGRRDGMEPPKIRMTRGALAHMYVQGELYPQAVAEIRSVLSQDPQRGDMQVLLALSYFKGGQKSDASDMCAQLLKRYPFCFDANRIMVELLPSTTGAAAESTQVYRMRVGELDPYTSFAKGSVFQSNDVPDAAINLERLDYKGDEVPMGQDWGTSLGIGLAASSAPALGSGSSADQPDWLKSGGFYSTSSSATPTPTPTSVPDSNNEIPDFLRAAGWGESNSPEKPTSIFDEEPASGDLTPADLPDWLKGQVPSSSAPPTKPLPDHAQTISTPDWLTGLGESKPSEPEVAPTQPGNVPDWLTGLGDSKPSEPIPAQAGNVPDWLSGLGDSKASESASAQPGNTPDWLSGFGEAKASVPVEPAQPANVPDWLSGLGDSKVTESAPAQPANVPDWLSGSGDSKISEPAQPANVPDWLSGLGDSQTSQPVEPAQANANLPDWLSGMDSSQSQPPQTSSQPVMPPPSPSVESLGATVQEQDDAVAWLESLAAKHGAKPEELVTDPNKRFETPPEWVSQAQNLNQQSPAAPTPAPSVESLGSTAQEQDDAVAWLESLAAKHGAKPEELVTDPSKRFETPPEWVSQAQNLNQQTPVQEPAPQASTPSVESLGSTAQEQDDAVAWLESLAAKHGAKPEELVTDPSKRFEKPPEWVSQAQTIGEAQAAASALEETQASSPQSGQVENALNIGEQFFAEFETASTAQPAPPASDETGVWLRGLDEKEKSDETVVQVASDSKMDQAEEQNLQRSDIPEWLSDAQTPPSSGGQFDFAEPDPSKQKLDLPNWLSGVDEEYATQDTFGDKGIASNDLSDWLSGLDDEPGLPFGSLPTPDSILTEPKSTPPVVVNSELPDWLSGVDSKQPIEDVEEDQWKKSIAPEESVSLPTEQPAPVSEKEDLPEWLQGVDEKNSDIDQASLDDDTPPWLHREKYEAEVPQQPKPTSPSDWHPAVESVPAQKQAEPAVETRKTFVPPSPEPVAQRPVETYVSEKSAQPAPAKKKPGLPAKQRQPQAQNTTVVLDQAKSELDRGDIPTALEHYGKLIKKGKHLEETIRDLTESIYRYPVEVGIWQTLGDAYMRDNRLKEALEAYNKAEELIR